MHGGRTAIAGTSPPRVRILDDWLTLSLHGSTAAGGAAPVFTVVATKLECSAALAAASAAVHGHCMCVMPSARTRRSVEVVVAGGDAGRGNPCSMHRVAVDIVAGTVDLERDSSTCSQLQALRRSSRLIVVATGADEAVAAALPRNMAPGMSAPVDIWRLRWSPEGVAARRVSRLPARTVASTSVRLVAGVSTTGGAALFGCAAAEAPAQPGLWWVDGREGQVRGVKRDTAQADLQQGADAKRCRHDVGVALDGRPRCMLSLAHAGAGDRDDGKPPGCAYHASFDWPLLLHASLTFSPFDPRCSERLV